VRLFFALWPSDRVRSDLARWVRTVVDGTRARAVAPERLHLTLAFLGEIDPARLDGLGSLAAEIRGQAFELVLDRVGFWARSRIVYAAPATVHESLADLAAQLAGRLRAAQFRTEARAFAPHVTLARDARSRPGAMEPAPIRWPVADYALVESRSRERGPGYRVLRRWTLRG